LLLVSLIAAATLSGSTQAEQALRPGVEQLAQGNLRHHLDYQCHNQLRDSSSALKGMAQSVQHRRQELSDAVERSAAAAEQTAQVSHQTSDGIRRQQLETDQVATAMHEMSATVQDVAGNAASAAQAAEQADQQAESGKRVVQQTIEAIDGLASEVEHAATVIHELEANSGSISSDVHVIRSIADQTNLRALTAAIQAACGGVPGQR